MTDCVFFPDVPAPRPQGMKILLVLALVAAVGCATLIYDDFSVCRTLQPRHLLWVVILESCLAAFTACGIGANDVANCFGTSVGLKSLKLRQAVVIAVFAEFLGAFLMGSNVTKTVGKNIVPPKHFVDHPEFIMIGMFCADFATGLWLAVATYSNLPVSTTHSIIGALVGFGLASKGWNVVGWETVWKVVLSWFTAPLSSGAVAAILFWLLRRFILRHTNSFGRALRLYPVLCVFTLWINLFFLMYKGTAKLKKFFKTIHPALGCLICLGIAVVVAAAVGLALVPLIRKRINTMFSAEEAGSDALRRNSVQVQAKSEAKIEED